MSDSVLGSSRYKVVMADDSRYLTNATCQSEYFSYKLPKRPLQKMGRMKIIGDNRLIAE